MFKVGDKVFIKTNVTKHSELFNNFRECYKGKVATITKTYDNLSLRTFTLDIDNGMWTWIAEWVEYAYLGVLTEEELNRIKKVNNGTI